MVICGGFILPMLNIILQFPPLGLGTCYRIGTRMPLKVPGLYSLGSSLSWELPKIHHASNYCCRVYFRTCTSGYVDSDLFRCKWFSTHLAHKLMAGFAAAFVVSAGFGSNSLSGLVDPPGWSLMLTIDPTMNINPMVKFTFMRGCISNSCDYCW